MIEIKYTDQSKKVVVQDKQLNSSDTPLTFLGKQYSGGYSTIIGENFLHLLENFCYGTPPENPVQGQIWFNNNTITKIDGTSGTSEDSYGLKIYDGTNWLPIGIIKKSAQTPTVQSAESTNLSLGDLYVDTAKQQLYIYNGTGGWTLIGPQFNTSERTGAEVELIVDSANNLIRPILTIFVKTRRVAIISDNEFTPKSIIDGFSTIKQGINLSTSTFSTTSQGTKFWGVAEKAEALISGDETITTRNFLRSDQTSTTNFGFNIRNNNGVSIGNDLSFSMGTEGGAGYLYNKIVGSSIDLRIRKSNAIKTILRISPTNDNIQLGSVGINNTAPEESLDVVGNIKSNGRLIISGNAANSIYTQGGLSVLGVATVGNNLTVTGTTTAKNILPQNDVDFNLGAPDKKWSVLYADRVGTETSPTNFFGSFYGNFTGNLQGSATRLAAPITISIAGDIGALPVVIQNSGTSLTLQATLRPEIISTKTESTTFLPTDEFLIERDLNLYKVKKSTIVKTMPLVPLGTILLFSGNTSQIPAGYELCDGRELNQNQYNRLFGLIRYTYKPENQLINPPLGIPSFALPDLRSIAPTGTNYIIYTGNIV